MNRSNQLIFLLLCPCAALVSLSGCSTTLAKIDQVQMRDRLMEFTEEQIMDNLIRAKENRAIVHFDPDTIMASVKTGLTGGVGAGQTLTRGGTLLGQAVVSASRPFTLSATPSRDNAIGLNIKALLDKNEVYAAYEYFVSLPKSVVEGHPPAHPKDDDEREHIGQRGFNGKYYYVPEKYAKDYFQLCLRVAAKRGPVSESEKTAGLPPGSSAPTGRAGKKSIPLPLRSPDVSPDSTTSPILKTLEDSLFEMRQRSMQ